jgi:UDP-N-acetylglucosamine--N-acetylmuramyl-(pentapeptide) pyrophosphoryl-undecaprenol N-acetylglucosamine transferase
MTNQMIMLAAGGTGGHLFPAQALAEELVQRGWRTQLVTDERVRDYGKSFPAEKTHIIESATLTAGKPWKLPGQFLKLYRGSVKAKRLFALENPAAVVGFGGYPSFPPLLAATQVKLPTLVHEQNAVLGRANGMLGARVNAIASSFAAVRGITPQLQSKVFFTGNPVRAVALQYQASAYPELSSRGPFKLVVFGGSQGARYFSEFMPQVLKAMDPAMREKLEIVQQCRPEDLASTQQLYAGLGLAGFELQSFFSDMPKRIANAHLVVCRSGASSIAELGVIGRPAVMVPLPGALDNDQLRNAESFAAAGAGWVKPQSGLEATSFAEFLLSLFTGGMTLPAAAAKALTHGKPDAAKRLADLVINTIVGHAPRQNRISAS